MKMTSVAQLDTSARNLSAAEGLEVLGEQLLFPLGDGGVEDGAIVEAVLVGLQHLLPQDNLGNALDEAVDEVDLRVAETIGVGDVE